MPIRVAADRVVGVAALATGLSVACQFGAIALAPLFAQGVIGTSATSSGLVLMAQALAGVGATIVVGQWVSRTGRYRRSALLGPLVLAVGMLLLASAGADTTV